MDQAARPQGGRPSCSTRRFLPRGTEAGLRAWGVVAHPYRMRGASGTLLRGGDTGGSHHSSPCVPSAGRETRPGSRTAAGARPPLGRGPSCLRTRTCPGQQHERCCGAQSPGLQEAGHQGPAGGGRNASWGHHRPAQPWAQRPHRSSAHCALSHGTTLTARTDLKRDRDPHPNCSAG